MKGIILAGGHGSRLHPITIPYSKQLLPVFDKPLIYYPLCTLMRLKIRDILIIIKQNQKKSFYSLLGNGSKFGLNIKYAIQNKPNGIAESLLIGEKFIKDQNVALILGDNIFYGQDFKKNLDSFDNKQGATIFLYQVNNPSQYGVANFKKNKINIIIEKPKKPKSNKAVTGLYIFDKNVTKLVKKLKPSKRGELEITDLNNIYIKENRMNYINIKNSSVWFDAGTPSSLLLASQYVQAVQERNNILISSPEETAFINQYINKEQYKKLLINNKHNHYYQTLENLIK